MSSLPFALAVHGGAGTIAPGSGLDEAPYHEGLRVAVAAGQAVLASGGSALDAVVAAVVSLEDCPLFNAGRGAVLTSDATHELDASVMDGQTLASGAVAGVRCVRNPVRAAFEVMRQGRCVLMGAEGAERMAVEAGLEMVDPSYFFTPERLVQLREVQASLGTKTVLDHDTSFGQSSGDSGRFGTVGAVALDRHGHLAAATSTGGMTNKLPGRIGDTPIVGAGVYANDATCAVSCTGTGEHFIRACLAHDIHARMLYLKQDVEAAAGHAFSHSLAAVGGRGGAIVVGRDGTITMPFNSNGMFRASVREGEAVRTAIRRED